MVADPSRTSHEQQRGRDSTRHDHGIVSGAAHQMSHRRSRLFNGAFQLSDHSLIHRDRWLIQSNGK
jgi:hypothetical protein